MKNKFKGLMLSTLCFVVLFMVTGCGNKVAISSSDFKTKMEKKGYTVDDVTSQFDGYDYLSKVYIALSSDSAYQIEFYELSDVDSASILFDNSKAAFENSKSSDSPEDSVDLENHEKYTLTTNGQFKVVSRIDNTVIYLDVPDTYKSSVEGVLKDLGY